MIIRNSKFVNKSDRVVVQSDESRKQSDNLEACFKKLHEMILHAARDVVPGETSDEKSKHVKQL